MAENVEGYINGEEIAGMMLAIVGTLLPGEDFTRHQLVKAWVASQVVAATFTEALQLVDAGNLMQIVEDILMKVHGDEKGKETMKSHLELMGSAAKQGEA